MSQAPVIHPPHNALAVTALALGFTGLILSPLLVGGLLGLAAMILGTLALRRKVRRGMAAGGIVTGLLALAVALGVAVLFIIAPRLAARAREAAATNNLQQLATGASTYAAAHNGQMPQRMGQLAPYLRGDIARVLRDPRNGLMRGGGGRGGRLAPAVNTPAFHDAVDQASEFCYAGAGVKAGEGRVILLYDKAVAGVPRLVVFADGRVESFAGGSPELHAAVKGNNEARERLGLPPLRQDLDAPPPVATTAAASRARPEK